MDLYVRVTFVILQAYVVLGTVLLDQVHLEDKRLEFRPDQDPFDMSDLPHQAARLMVMTGICMEIRPDTVLYIDGLANIDDCPLGVFHQVATGFGRQGGKDALEVTGYFHGDNFTSS